MRVLGLIHVVFSLLAIGLGVVVLHGVLQGRLCGKWPLRFLRCSLIASLAGVLPPSRHLSLTQVVCMLSVYCSGVVVLAWIRFDLAGIWRPVFAFFATVLLYLNIVSVSIELFRHSQMLAMAPNSVVEFAKLSVALIFAMLGTLALRMSDPRHTH